MKKNVWLLGVAVAALTSCTQSEVLDIPERKLIAFDSHVDKATRSAVIIGSKQTLNEFYVYGKYGATNTALSDLFSGTDFASGYATVTKNSGGSYSYEPHQIWEEGKLYHFAAYSDGNNLVTSPATVAHSVTNAGENKLTISGYTAGNNDLIASVLSEYDTQEDGSGIPTGRVVFQFEHLLSRVRFEVENTSTAESDIAVEITDITLSAVKKADCEIGEDGTITWTNGTDGDYTFDFIDQIIPAHTDIADMFVIPQSNDLEIDIKLESFKKDSSGNYTIPTGTKVLEDVSLAFSNGPSSTKTNYWHPGWVYNYIIKYGGDATYIHFDAAVSDWDYDFDGNGDSGTNDDIVVDTSTTP